MLGLTRKQARILQTQISRIFGRSYIPIRTGNSTLSIGDILISKRDIVPFVDGGQFSENATSSSDGKGFNQNITSSSSMAVSTKIAGQVDPKDLFKVDEAGISVSFESDKEMFLKVQNLRQRTINNFVELRREILSRFVQEDIRADIFVVRGLVLADKYFLQFGAKRSGEIGLTIDSSFEGPEANANADFKIKWKNDVGFSIDGYQGGVLGYRVSSIRLRRHLRTEGVQSLILSGISEADAINTLSAKERKSLFEKDAFDLIDVTDELVAIENEYSEVV